jgi:hypothetical protein
VQVKDPRVFEQLAFTSQLFVLIAHSLISTQEAVPFTVALSQPEGQEQKYLPGRLRQGEPAG